MRLLKIKTLKGTIKTISGLHIGSGNDVVEIGGMDNPIIRNPLTGAPYIPGSSLKGKMRSLMEWYENRVAPMQGRPCNCGKCKVCRVFGVSAAELGKSEDESIGPTRIIVRDSVLNDHWKKEYDDGKPIVESKSENSINRLEGKATNPRPVERVVPDVEFNFEISYRVIDTGDEGKTDLDNFTGVVLRSLALLEKDYLGGMGSRGSGKIRFMNLTDEEGNSFDLNGVI